MKIITVNEDNIPFSDISKIVTRCKAIITNHEKEILLGYSHNCYQFPGGHLEDNESHEDCLTREVKEETGISLCLDNQKPFLLQNVIYNNYYENNENTICKIYYYHIYTDDQINLEETTYTEEEIEGNYELRYIKFEDIENELISNAANYPVSKNITKEMLTAIEVFFEENK